MKIHCNMETRKWTMEVASRHDEQQPASTIKNYEFALNFNSSNTQRS